MIRAMERSGRVLRHFVALSLLLPLAGCFTTGLWELAPRVAPERLIGASVDGEGQLELGVEMNDGSLATFRESSTVGRDLRMKPDPTLAAENVAWPCTPDAGGRVALRPVPRFLDDEPNAVIDGKWRGDSSLAVESSEGARRGTIDLFEVEQPIRWSHPGTWCCVVATPVSAAVDVVLSPLMLVVFLIRPGC
jgi:hypothetical protein